jgi:hypothetical protein
MEPPRKPRLLRIYPQTTPSHNDHPDADKFYCALGVAIVAWGRLENNFAACLMMVIQIAKDKRIGMQLPMKWERQALVWNDAFARIPSLKSHEKDAIAFLAEFGNLSEDRNLMIHALWEDFHLQPPLAVNVLKFKAVRGTPNVVEFRRTTINIDGLARFTAKANDLNLGLMKLGKDLSALQGPPSSDAQIL